MKVCVLPVFAILFVAAISNGATLNFPCSSINTAMQTDVQNAYNLVYAAVSAYVANDFQTNAQMCSESNQALVYLQQAFGTIAFPTCQQLANNLMTLGNAGIAVKNAVDTAVNGGNVTPTQCANVQSTANTLAADLQAAAAS